MKKTSPSLIFWRQTIGLIAIIFAGISQVFALPPAPPKLESIAFLLQDFDSGRILARSHENARVAPASITKMMSAFVVFEKLKSRQISLDDEVLVSKKAWKTRGSKMFIEVDTKVRVDDLLKGMIVQSGNDATIALAEHVAGSEAQFVEIMNQYAKSLGMSNTHFVNSTGWPVDDHYTSATDIVRLSRALIKKYSTFYQLHGIKEFTYNNIKQYNRNKLLWRDSSVDGIKTGHTESAGYCLVSSAKRDGMRLIAVVFGARNKRQRNDENKSLLDFGFRYFETHRLYQKEQSLQTARVWKGLDEMIDLGLSDDLYVTIARGQHEFLNTEVVFKEPIVAPVKEGIVFGTIKVTLGSKEIARADVYTLNDVSEGGFWRRTVDEVKLWFY